MTLVPLVWLLAVTMTAGVEKIFEADPKIGFLAEMKLMDQTLPKLEQALVEAQKTGSVDAIKNAQLEIHKNRANRFNKNIDAIVAALFLFLVLLIVLLSVREWILLLARKKLAQLHETEPVWLPDYAIAETKPLRIFSLFALAFALAKHLSGESEMERTTQKNICSCEHSADKLDSKSSRKKVYVQVTEKRFKGVNRCC